MKLLKSFILLFTFVSFISCGDDDDAPSFDLSTGNLAGSFSVNELEEDDKKSTIVSGVTVNVSTATAKGSVFQIAVTIGSNNTYSATGTFLYKKTETITGTSPVDTERIITLNESGTYSLNTTDRKINFISSGSSDLLNGLYEITRFTETNLSLKQNDSKTENGITTETETVISLVKG